jgi:hypothetical protein
VLEPYSADHCILVKFGRFQFRLSHVLLFGLWRDRLLGVNDHETIATRRKHAV